MDTFPEHRRTALPAGAAAFIGGRLAAALTELGCRVRCAVRREDACNTPRSLDPAPASAEDGLLDADSLATALRGADAAHSLVHATAGDASGKHVPAQETSSPPQTWANADESFVSPLIEGLKDEVRCRDNRIRAFLPHRLRTMERSHGTAITEASSGAPFPQSGPGSDRERS